MVRDQEADLSARLAELERCFLRPARVDLDELALAIDYRGRDPGKLVWQRAIAADRIPASWADDPRRRFWATRGELQTLGERSDLELGEPGRFVLAAPATARAALLFASDPRGLAEAEALARELISRFEIWGCPPATRVIWRLAGNPVAPARARAPSLGALAPALARLRAVLGRSERIYEPPHPHRRFQWVVDALFWSRSWQLIRASEIPARVHAGEGEPTEPTVPTALVGRALADLQNPLEPWLALASTGYSLSALQVESDGVATIELAAPFAPARASSRRDPVRSLWSQRLGGLRLACMRGDVGWLRRELPLLPGDDEPDQARLIHFASYGGSAALGAISEFMSLDLEARDPLDRSALMLAAGLPSAGPAGATMAEINVPISEIVGAAACEWLLAAGADSEARDAQGFTALHWAAQARRPRCAAALLEGGASVDASDHRGRTALMLALASQPLSELIELLLSAGADPDARDHHGWSSLHYLASVTAGRRQRVLARRLVERGARPSRDRAGRSPARLCALQGLEHTDGGPFDPRTTVAAGPGAPTRVFEPTLVPRLLDELVPEQPDPTHAIASRPRSRSTENWVVWADWLQSRGDPRGELAATSLACARVAQRQRQRIHNDLTRLELRAASTTHAAVYCADPQAPIRSPQIKLSWTHGFVTAADLSRLRLRGGLDHRETVTARVEAAQMLLAHEPLLAELRLGTPGREHWEILIAGLRGLDEPATRLRRLVLDNLPAWLPQLDGLDQCFPALRSLHLRGHSRISAGALRWPGLTHLRMRQSKGPELAGASFDVELDLPQLTHLDFGLPSGAGVSSGDARGVARMLSSAQQVQHLRLGPLTQDFAAAILPGPLIARLRTLELAGVRGTALATVARHADTLRGLERLRVSVAPAVAEQHGAVIRELRRELPTLELDTRPGRRPSFLPW